MVTKKVRVCVVLHYSFSKKENQIQVCIITTLKLNIFHAVSHLNVKNIPEPEKDVGSFSDPDSMVAVYIQ